MQLTRCILIVDVLFLLVMLVGNAVEIIDEQLVADSRRATGAIKSSHNSHSSVKKSSPTTASHSNSNKGAPHSSKSRVVKKQPSHPHAAQSIPMNAMEQVTAVSNCSYNFGFNEVDESVNEELPSVFHFNAVPPDRRSLKAVNVGFGTTGTHAVYSMHIHKYSVCCHWAMCSKPHFRNDLQVSMRTLLDCTAGKLNGAACSTAKWMQQLRHELHSAATNGLQSLGDTPTYYVARELLDLVPSLHVSHTLRDPLLWTVKRIAEHGHVDGDDLLCNPDLPQNHNISSPFHILQCIEHSEVINENVMFMRQYIGISHLQAKNYLKDYSSIPSTVASRIRQVAHYYSDFNQRLRNLVTKNKNQYTTICLWDH